MTSPVAVLLLSGAALAASPQASGPAPVPLELHPVESALLEETNRQRARYGVPPLAIDRPLQESARRHTAWMARSGQLRHTSRPVAENIAMGQRTSVEAVSSWMQSAGHRANLLNPRHTRIGVAAYRSPGGATYWCQQFR